MLGLAKEAASPQAAHAEWLDTFNRLKTPPEISFRPRKATQLDCWMERWAGCDFAETLYNPLASCQNGGWPTDLSRSLTPSAWRVQWGGLPPTSLTHKKLWSSHQKPHSGTWASKEVSMFDPIFHGSKAIRQVGQGLAQRRGRLGFWLRCCWCMRSSVATTLLRCFPKRTWKSLLRICSGLFLCWKLPGA